MADDRRRRLITELLSTFAAEENNADVTAAYQFLSNQYSAILLISSSDNRSGTPGSASWRSLFRIKYALFQKLSQELRPAIEFNDYMYRKALPAELKVAAFLLYAGGSTCEKAASHLGIGVNTVSLSVMTVSKWITLKYKDAVRFPTEGEDVARAMKGFENLSGLPYCVGSIDVTHLKWPSGPEEQYYDYRCYKGYPSIALFAVATADRRFIFVDIGKPGVLGDSTIFEQSVLKNNIEDGNWMGPNIPSLLISGICVRPYLIGDFAFQLTQNMMKSCSDREKRANPVLRTWDKVASTTRKPVECAFGMFKHRFYVLRYGLRLHHENEIVLFVLDCVVLYNWSIEDRGDEDIYLAADEEGGEEVLVTSETREGKKQRDALFYYIKNEFHAD